MPWIEWFRTRQGHHLPGPVRRGVVVFGRIGFVSRGVIYASVGTLALMAALGLGGDLTDPQGAMAAIGQLPLGWGLVVLIAAGLAGYAVWRTAQAVFNLEHLDDSAQAHGWRVYQLLDGVMHGAWAAFVVMMLLGAGGADQQGDEAARQWTARLMARTGGRWLVGAIGAMIILAGAYLVFRAVSTRFRDHWKSEHLPALAVGGALLAARVGETARGLAFGLVGLFFLRAAWRFDPDEARGLGESLQALAVQPFGRLMLGAVALGFILYGVYSLVEAKYRRIGRSEGEQE